MRIFLLAASAMLALPASANGATRNFGITSFEKVRVEGPFRVRLTTGIAPFAKASGSPAAIDHVAIEMRGNTLVVRSNASSWGGYPGQESGPVEISLGTHDLSSALLNGSGTLAIDKIRGLTFDLSVQGSGGAKVIEANVDQLNVAVIGTASAAIAGKTAKLTALVSGISSLDASNLAAKDAVIGAQGAATVWASVSNAAKVDGSGPATIKLSGNPACSLRVSGSTSVSGCKSTQ
ncbi:MAG TPA: DUF2807 domain-containing protein [Sphingomicrobium sp.]